jgi:hypothetical protein
MHISTQWALARSSLRRSILPILAVVAGLGIVAAATPAEALVYITCKMTVPSGPNALGNITFVNPLSGFVGKGRTVAFQYQLKSTKKYGSTYKTTVSQNVKAGQTFAPVGYGGAVGALPGGKCLAWIDTKG